MADVFDWDGLARSSILIRRADVVGVAARHRADLVYLATPYSKIARKPDGRFCPVRSDACAAEAARWVAMFAASGVTAVSPVVAANAAVLHRHRGGVRDPLHSDFWESWCRPLLFASQVVVVPPIDGWRESVGIWREVTAALACNAPVYLIALPESGVRP